MMSDGGWAGGNSVGGEVGGGDSAWTLSLNCFASSATSSRLKVALSTPACPASHIGRLGAPPWSPGDGTVPDALPRPSKFGDGSSPSACGTNAANKTAQQRAMLKRMACISIGDSFDDYRPPATGFSTGRVAVRTAFCNCNSELSSHSRLVAISALSLPLR